MRGARQQGLSLRARLLALGVAGVAIALALGSLVLYAVLTFTLNRALDDGAFATARTVAAMVSDDAVPNPLPVSGSQVVQVIDSSGAVVSASMSADRLTPLLRPPELTRALAGERISISGARAGLSGTMHAIALRTGSSSASRSIIVAVPARDIEQAQRVLRNTLLIAYPPLVFVMALIAWRVIGSTLAPVETLRSGAARISGSDQDERLAVPESADEIRALALTLNDMLDRLAAARGRQRAFVADAAHELRSPLASMRTQLEVAQHLGEGGELAADLLADVNRLSALVEDLLLLARAGSDTRHPPVRGPVEVRALLVATAARYAGARVPVSVADGRPVYADVNSEELRRALANLADNAVRHASTGVVLAVRADSSGAVLTVVDDGPGIPVEERERVFERFARLDDARDRDAGGTGLGLAIVKELLSRSDASIRLQDSPAGPGLAATVHLPRKPRDHAGTTPQT
ncbi:MAG TPA: HAMP domain-containing sensor histidine kinase [Dermatophilaceae bacterium]